jgi:hypothetical protein
MNFPGKEEKENDRGKRKFQCFVCGRQYSEYEEYKAHILENHDEGREYIICPVAHCKAPIRDLRLHAKAKHPQFDLKSYKGQLKSTVWYDFSPKGKRRMTTKFRQGKYTSIKSGKTFHYRSGLEATVYELLDQDHEVMSFDAEPFQIDYVWGGQAHKYTPDILVTYMDGHKELWEIKPADQTELQQNQYKWDAAKQQCKARGWLFEVYTEPRIDKLKMKIRNQNLFD